ncbi:MAG: sigma-E processing peptidase SpoIIGA [Acutalibacteraceae bacterium]|nr:sigma-E processing peptidase SpoIIGA [Acutalibacteraceae bacterium]
MVVYADVLLIVNLFVNYVLLLCSSMIMKKHTQRLRMLLGAAIGAFYGFVVFLPELPSLAEFALRIATTVLIVLGAFGYKNLPSFLRSFFTFFAVSFAFGGIMLVLWVTVAPIGMIYNNGAVYFDIDLAVLAISTVVSFAVVSLIAHFTARRAPKDSIALVKISYKGKEVKLTALIDTGNSLCETFSGYPVVLGEAESLEKIMPDAVRAFIDGDDVSSSPEMRLVMHKTVSGTGVLPVFRPDYIEVKSVSHSIKTSEVYVAVTKNNLARGEYEMILNPALFEEEKRYAQAFK